MKKIINLLTCSLTLTLLGGCNFNKYSYEEHQKYVSGSDFTLESKIDEIEVAWVNGNKEIGLYKDGKTGNASYGIKNFAIKNK